MRSEGLFHLLETVIQGGASSRARQFAQRLRDTVDEELVAPLETFAAAAHGEPDPAEELDRADEAAETEVDEETTSPAQQRQLLRAHVNLGHPTIGEVPSCVAKRSMPPRSCQVGTTLFQMSGVRSTTDAKNSAGGSSVEMLPFQSGLPY